ncbi:MAG: type I-D CRISPR-associated helicase Cas3' [Acidobacteriaceae bacterium]|nr:type I-D CRISPR-associated helicase Cas3' [Acidobacteriaceae bacterium]
MPLVEHPDSRRPLYPHQAAMLEAWNAHSSLLLASKTGSGKTRAAMFPVLWHREYAIAVYPTNELLRDQVRAVEKIALDEGIRAEIHRPDKPHSPHADHVLIPIDAPLLDLWQRGRTRSRGEALRNLLSRERPRIIFTNPDILFNILSAQYHLDALAPLDIYNTIIFDEFHLYQNVELAHALMMVYLARGLGFFRRVVLLTATPHPEVRDLLDKIIQPTEISSKHGSDDTRTRTAVHDVYISPIVAAEDPVDQITSRILKALPDLKRLREKNPDDSYIPAVAIVNSVLDAIRVEDEIVARDFDRNLIAVIRGLSNRALRERAGKLIAVGTSAIEVGVDFDCDLLFFEAFEAASFLQRFGRAGRHRESHALMFVPPNAFEAMSACPESMDRSSFERLIHICYPLAEARPWFAATEYGLLAAASIAERLFRTVQKDHKAGKQYLSRFQQRLDNIFSAYAAALGCDQQLLSRVEAKVNYSRNGNPKMSWYRAYLQLERFRTSMPSVEIHDWLEQARRGNWNLGTYEIDLSALLRRGRNIRRNTKAGLTITGVGSTRRVHAGESVAHLSRGVPLRTSVYPIHLLQDGLDTPISGWLSDTDHVFTVVPRADVDALIDWRLTCFEAGSNVLAFDGAALLLIEIYRRRQELSTRVL